MLSDVDVCMCLSKCFAISYASMSILAQLNLQFPDLLTLFVKESDVVALLFSKVADNEFECC